MVRRGSSVRGIRATQTPDDETGAPDGCGCTPLRRFSCFDPQSQGSLLRSLASHVSSCSSYRRARSTTTAHRGSSIPARPTPSRMGATARTGSSRVSRRGRRAFQSRGSTSYRCGSRRKVRASRSQSSTRVWIRARATSDEPHGRLELLRRDRRHDGRSGARDPARVSDRSGGRQRQLRRHCATREDPSRGERGRTRWGAVVVGGAGRGRALRDRPRRACPQLLLGRSQHRSDPGMANALAAAVKADALVVFSAGNDGVDLEDTHRYVEQPNADAYGLPNTLTVANFSNSGTLAPDSNYGARHVQIAWLGDALWGDYPNSTGGGSVGGTSAAAATVSGVAALLFAADPMATAARVRRAIIVGANRNAPSLRQTNEAGGLLSATGALAALAHPDTAAPLPFRALGPAKRFRLSGRRTVTLRWSPSRDSELKGYKVTLDGALHRSTDTDTDSTRATRRRDTQLVGPGLRPLRQRDNRRPGRSQLRQKDQATARPQTPVRPLDLEVGEWEPRGRRAVRATLNL